MNAAVMNHGGPTTKEKVQAVKQPFMVNGSDNDNSIPKDMLDEIKSVLDNKPDVPSDVKVGFRLPVCKRKMSSIVLATSHVADQSQIMLMRAKST